MSAPEGGWELNSENQRKLSRPAGPSGPSLDRVAVVTHVDPVPATLWTEAENPLPSTLSILLPALNEEKGVRSVLQRIPRKRLQRQGLTYSVYLIDGHSTDRTRSVAKKLGAEIFVQTGNGKGSAIREFVPKITEDVTVLLDSDGTYPPEVIPQLVGALGEESPVVLGSRFRGSRIEPGAMSRLNYLGNRFLSIFASLLFGIPISDVCSGMWAFRSNRLKSLDLGAKEFELEVEIFAECALRHIPIAEIPIRYRKRIGGKAKLRVREGFGIAFALLKKRVQSRAGLEVANPVEVELPAAGPVQGAG